MQRKVGTSYQNKPKIFLHETSLSRRKTQKMPENTEFLGGVVEKMCYQNDLNMYIGNVAEKSAAFFSSLRAMGAL